MNNSTKFKQAHKLTKNTIKTGDSYSATFAICLKTICEMDKVIAQFDFNNLTGTFEQIICNPELQAVAQASVNRKGEIQTINFDALLNADISEYDADNFVTAIENCKIAQNAGHLHTNAKSTIRELLNKLSIRVLRKKLRDL